MGLAQYLGLSAVLFCLGIYGIIVRRNAIMVLLAVELVLNAVNINLLAFGAFHDDAAGQVFALFVIAIAAAEVAIGLAIVFLVQRRKDDIDVRHLDELKG